MALRRPAAPAPAAGGPPCNGTAGCAWCRFRLAAGGVVSDLAVPAAATWWAAGADNSSNSSDGGDGSGGGGGGVGNSSEGGGGGAARLGGFVCAAPPAGRAGPVAVAVTLNGGTDFAEGGAMYYYA